MPLDCDKEAAPDEWISTKEAAKLLGLHPVTLRKWRKGSQPDIADPSMRHDKHGLMYRPSARVKYLKSSVLNLIDNSL